MVELSLEVRASALQESPDIVVLAGHSGLPHPRLGADITQTLFFGVCQRNPMAWRVLV